MSFFTFVEISWSLWVLVCFYSLARRELDTSWQFGWDGVSGMLVDSNEAYFTYN